MDDVAANPGTTWLWNTLPKVLGLLAIFEAGLAVGLAALIVRLAQRSWECIEAQASPAATIVKEFEPVEEAAEFASRADAATILSQPSMQPAPAIQSATETESATRMIFIVERDVISLLSLNRVRLGVEPYL